MNSERLTNDEILSQFESELSTALEYGKLLSLPNPSEEQADRLGAILEQAVDNSVLHFCLSEIDHFIAHYFGLLDEDDRESYKDQQALVKEYLGRTICQIPMSEELERAMTESRQLAWNDLPPSVDKENYNNESTLDQVYH